MASGPPLRLAASPNRPESEFRTAAMSTGPQNRLAGNRPLWPNQAHVPIGDRRCLPQSRDQPTGYNAGMPSVYRKHRSRPKSFRRAPRPAIAGHDEILAYVAFAHIAPNAACGPHPLDARTGDKAPRIPTPNDLKPSLRNPPAWEKRNAPHEPMKMLAVDKEQTIFIGPTAGNENPSMRRNLHRTWRSNSLASHPVSDPEIPVPAGSKGPERPKGAKDRTISQPHDSLFRHLMSSHDNASSFLQGRVPPQIAAEGEWPHLRLISGALFGNALERFECDLLYSLPIRDPHTNGKTELLIYILFEHQSRREPMMPLRLLEYMLGIWRRWLEDHSAAEGLPAILPLVLSQVEGGWNLSPEFADLLNCPAAIRPILAKHLPHFEHLTFDLASTREDDIPGNERVRAALALMKAVMESRVREWIEWAPPAAARAGRGEPACAAVVCGQCGDAAGLAGVFGESKKTKHPERRNRHHEHC